MRFTVLGPLAVSNGGAPIDIGGPKPTTVLAILIASDGHQVSADTLVDAVWGEKATRNARRTVQTYISSLRSQLGEVIEKTKTGWRFVAEGHHVDAKEFESLINSGRELVEAGPERAAEILREALSLWHGRPYSGVEAHGYLDSEITRLDELRASAAESRIDADLAAGRHRDLIGELEALLTEHPFREQLRAQHMTALYRSGRQREALQSYSQMRVLLRDELGIDPNPGLQDLEQRILEQDPTLQEPQGRSIQRRAILVADPGDPLEIASLTEIERTDLIARASAHLEAVVKKSAGSLYPAGMATYAVFDSPEHAASAAASANLRSDGQGLRIAIDWGDVEVDDASVDGPPVSRAARLVALAHRGQVLLSGEAQQALSSSGGPGLRFETLGSFDVPGLEGTTSIYQLLVGNPPRTYPDLITNRTPPPLPGGTHRSLPGYELREPVGPGSVGELYTAYQPSVGREVLIEVIGRSQASDPDFIRHFEADAQRLYLLDHPNINPVVDYWREPDGAFVVYRHHRGGMLNVTEAATPDRLIAQIGSALTYAHSYGLAHGSLAPNRILLDENGNGYLIGFPIGRVDPIRQADYPEYIAPESLGGGKATASWDLYALAMLAHELAVSRRVSGDSDVVSENPIIARALSDSPGGRQADLTEFLVALNPEGSDSPERRFTEARNPYKGLSAFHESDAGDFFGRNDVTGQLTEMLRHERFLAVVGPSGSGKSSVVRAGLTPRLRQGDIEGSERWVITDMLPGSHPFLELRRALERVAVDMPIATLEALASESPDSLADIDSLIPSDSGILILVDQFEELFTLASEETRARFIELLIEVARGGTVRVVITMRADFLDRPLRYSKLADLLDGRMVILGSPGPDQLREAVMRPAEGVGLSVDPAVTERIVAEVHDRPGALPLLQHALSELFAARESDLLTLDRYEAVGGVVGSLGQRAEAIYQQLESDERSVCKQLLLRLLTIADDSAPTRRRVRVTDLGDLDAVSVVQAFARSRLIVFDADPDSRTPTIEVAHEALLTHWPRLAGWIEAAREDLAMSRRLEEALHDWEANERDDAYLLTGARLSQHQIWTGGGNLVPTEAETIYLEASTEHDQEQRAKRRRRRNWTMSGFAAAAVVAVVFGLLALQNARIASENAASANSHAQRADELADEAGRQATLADTRALEAQNIAILAKAEALAAGAVAVLDEDPELSVLLGIQALQLNPTSEATQSALNEAVQSHRTVFRIQDNDLTSAFAVGGSISPDGSLVSAFTLTADSPVLRVWRTSDQVERPLWEAYPQDGRIFTEGTFTTDGGFVVVYDDHNWLDDSIPASNGAWIFFDALTGDVVRRLPMAEPCLIASTSNGSPSPFIDVNLPYIMERNPMNANGSCGLVATAEMVAVDLLTGEARELGESFPAQEGPVTTNADGSLYAFAGAGKGAVRDLETNVEVLPLDRGIATLNSDGSLVLSGNDPLILIDVATGEKIREYPGFYFSAYFSSTERFVYAATDVGAVRIFDTFGGQQLLELRGPKGNMGDIAMTPDERLLYTAATDGSVLVWDVESQLVGTASTFTAGPFQDDEVGGDAFLALGNSKVTDEFMAVGVAFDRGQGSHTDIYDLVTHEVVRKLPGGVLAFSPDGSLIAIQVQPGTVELSDEEAGGSGLGGTYYSGGPFEILDVESGRTVTELRGPCTWYGNIDLVEVVPGPNCSDYPDGWVEFSQKGTFSPDGSMFAIGGQSGYVVVWDTTTGEIVGFVDSLDGGNRIPWGLVAVAFSPDGDHLAVGQWNAGAESVVRQLNTETWQIEDEIPWGQPVVLMRYTPNGKQILVADGNNDVWLVDAETLDPGPRFAGQQGTGVTDVELSPDGRFALVASQDGSAWLWDLQARRVALKLNFPGTVSERGIRNVEFIDELTLLVGSRNANVLISLDPAVLLEAARARVTRTFTAEECETYGIDECPTLEEIQTGA